MTTQRLNTWVSNNWERKRLQVSTKQIFHHRLRLISLPARCVTSTEKMTKTTIDSFLCQKDVTLIQASFCLFVKTTNVICCGSDPPAKPHPFQTEGQSSVRASLSGAVKDCGGVKMDLLGVLWGAEMEMAQIWTPCRRRTNQKKSPTRWGDVQLCWETSFDSLWILQSKTEMFHY